MKIVILLNVNEVMMMCSKWNLGVRFILVVEM